MKQKIGILSLGCPRNLVDAEEIAGRLKAKKYSLVEDLSKAQVVLVNTCAFIREAKEESIEAILDLVELKKQGRIKKIIVCGCLAQRYRDLFKELPEVDAFVGAPEPGEPKGRFALTPRHYAYLKICEGCLNRCSYCVIPEIKGPLKSRDEESLLRQARLFNRQGISELNIIGQDITGFGVDRAGKSLLPELLRKIIGATPDIGWIRLLYLNPERVSDELLELIASSARVCKYIDLPVQHINNRILKMMHRGADREKISALVKKIRKIIPGVCLRTSLIVGFPSETEEEFEELLDFVRDTGFERLGAFIYSREEGTPACRFKGHIPRRIKQERFNRVMSAQQEIAGKINSGFLGKIIPVLIEEKKGADYLGRTQYDAPEVDGVVYIKSGRVLKPGEFIRAEITDTLEYDLVGVDKQK
ncbi:MAG: MiaB/RimO family radical SAM methylthiotransferase [Candidatus Omnitrophica bacterium]|nr:MiaB/RimO family radical SAM methylthiotransferase [Candidatus Omnitrophota bacterium]